MREWHYAFIRNNAEMARHVARFLEAHFDYDVTVSGGRIFSVQDDDGDYVVHREDHDQDQDCLECFLDNAYGDVINALDRKFAKVNGRIGKETKLKFPKYQPTKGEQHGTV
jgi:hypothetical protein